MTDPIRVLEATADITLTIKTEDGRTEHRHVIVAVSEIKTFLSSGQNMMYLEGIIRTPPPPAPQRRYEAN